MQQLPIAAPFTGCQLTRQGVSAREAAKLVQRGSIEAIGRAVYARDPSRLELAPCVAYLARKFPGLHLGGATALGFHGAIPDGIVAERLQLWSADVVRMPQWFVDRFAAPLRTYGTIPAGLPEAAGIVIDKASGAPVSVPERALLEMLANVGVSQPIEEAAQIVRLLDSLRIDVLTELIGGCRNRKVLRLAHGLGSEAGLEWSNVAGYSLLPERRRECVR